jgi:glycosyltransferase involved in cell wall biosynthesis
MKQQRTILHVIDTTGPGGAERVFVDLANSLQKKGYRSIAIIRGKGWVYEELKLLDIKTIIYNSKGSFNLGFLWQLIKLIKTEHVDIIQSHLLGSNVYSALAGLICQKPVFATFHGAVDVSKTERLLKLKCLALNLGVTQFITVSKTLEREMKLSGLLDTNKAKVIYNGIDPGNYFRRDNSHLKKKLNLPNNALIVGSLGNVRPAKSYNTLIKAAAESIKNNPRLHFVIAGDNTKESSMRELIKLIDQLKLGGNIHFIGFLENSAHFLGMIDLFLLTSSSEGFSIATIEAIASGAPIISTKCGGPEEIATNGFDISFIKVGDYMALSKKLRDIDSITTNHSKEIKGSIFDQSMSFSSYEGLYEKEFKNNHV